MRVDIARAFAWINLKLFLMSLPLLLIGKLPRSSAFAISKAVRRSQKKFIAVTCHYDVIDWLDPDWVFCTDTMEFVPKKRTRPPVNLQVYRCGAVHVADVSAAITI